MPWKLWDRKRAKSACAQIPVEKTPSSGKASADINNPCLRCGACCAFFLVSFPSHEADQSTGGLVPFELTGESANSRRCMKGTEIKQPRCIALGGTIGAHVNCRIYKNRPSTCRAFRRSWELNVGNFLCDKARAAYGLHVFSQY
ncbi:MAG: YkgJ family cysteine cluster protein [Desulfofustis sp.]|nr:YkgJ family cysteine cluster protein [Desulfofustis sp.]MBT8353973.1 YkgJ family cysteine cluster protein [Desulfofustis sp.]